jgi:hypothetical protein
MARFRFTEFPLLAADSLFALTANSGSSAGVVVQDCQIKGGAIQHADPHSEGRSIWCNNLFEGVTLACPSPPKGGLWFWNNTFLQGRFLLAGLPGSCWFRDNFFDGTVLVQDVAADHDFNAYRAGASRWDPPAAHDQVLPSMAPLEGYQPGSLGPYYVPSTGSPLSALFNAGSRSAAQAGLYHHTIQHPDLPEFDSTVDMGFHYVAGLPGLTHALPKDTDQDGLADYEEDLNGNGLFDQDFAERDWLTPDAEGPSGSSSIDLELFTSLL